MPPAFSPTSPINSRVVAEAAAKAAAAAKKTTPAAKTDASSAGGWNAAGTVWTKPSNETAAQAASRLSNGGRVYQVLPKPASKRPTVRASTPKASTPAKKPIIYGSLEYTQQQKKPYVPPPKPTPKPAPKPAPNPTTSGPYDPNWTRNDPGPGWETPIDSSGVPGTGFNPDIWVYPNGPQPTQPTQPAPNTNASAGGWGNGTPTGKTMTITDWQGRPHEVPILLFYDKYGNPYEMQGMYY